MELNKLKNTIVFHFLILGTIITLRLTLSGFGAIVPGHGSFCAFAIPSIILGFISTTAFEWLYVYRENWVPPLLLMFGSWIIVFFFGLPWTFGGLLTTGIITATIIVILIFTFLFTWDIEASVAAKKEKNKHRSYVLENT